MNTQTLPFLNKYFHEPEYPHLTWYKGEKYSDALLILDNGSVYSKKPFIEEMDKSIMRILINWFSGFPLHKTNRIQYTNINCEETDKLISEKIKPKVIITFSKEISQLITEKHPAYLISKHSQHFIWKGIIKINSLFTSFYAINEVSDLEEMTGGLSRLMGLTAFDLKSVCKQLNTIQKPQNIKRVIKSPLKDSKVQTYLKNMMDFKYPNLINLSPCPTESIARAISNLDVFDIIVAQQLKDFNPFEDNQIPLTLKEYVELRKEKSSQEILKQYLNQETITYRKEITELNLVRLYYYLHFPDLSFEADWGAKMAYNMEMRDIIQGHANAHKEMLRKMVRLNL
jgi:hypothetical protein